MLYYCICIIAMYIIYVEMKEVLRKMIRKTITRELRKFVYKEGYFVSITMLKLAIVNS